MNKYKTHTCGELRISDVGKQVRIARMDSELFVI